MTAFLVPANAAFDTYSDLVAAINDWLDRNDMDTVAPQLVALAESRLRRELAGLLDEKTVSITAVSGVGSLPSDYSRPIRVLYDGDVLPNLSRTDAPNIADATTPTGYTFERGVLRLWPACDVTVDMLYSPTIPQLTSANPTNELLDRQPDLYFFGSLMFAEGYLANDNRAVLFKNLFDEALAEVKIYYMKQRHAGPLVPNIRNCP